jgi:hypothetical protein
VIWWLGRISLSGSLGLRWIVSSSDSEREEWDSGVVAIFTTQGGRGEMDWVMDRMIRDKECGERRGVVPGDI